MFRPRGLVAGRRWLRASVRGPCRCSRSVRTIQRGDEVHAMTHGLWGKRSGWAASLAGIGLLSLALAVLARAEDAPKLYVHIETPGRFSYSGDPTQVSILFKNEGTGIWTNPGIDIEGGFQVLDNDGNKLERAKVPPATRDGQPKVLEANGYFGKIVNLNQYFPKMSSIGTYRVTWTAPGIPEQSLATRIIRKYDPTKDYQAVLETEFGRIVIDFYRDLAPFHTRNFIDLVNLDFYNGLLFHRIVKGDMIF